MALGNEPAETERALGVFEGFLERWWRGEGREGEEKGNENGNGVGDGNGNGNGVVKEVADGLSKVALKEDDGA